MSKDYIPGRTEQFFVFEQFLTEQVVANGSQWGVPANVVTELQTRSSAYAQLFETIVNRKVRTSQQVDAHQLGRRAYTAFLRQLVQAYLVNNPEIPQDMKRAMGLRPRQGRGSRPAIATMPVPVLRAMGGGVVRCEFRIEGSSSRTSLHPDSNGVELRISYAMPADTTRSGEEGKATLLREETMVRTRSGFRLDTGMKGRVMRVSARWANTVQPEKSGPWCEEQTLFVS